VVSVGGGGGGSSLLVSLLVVVLVLFAILFELQAPIEPTIATISAKIKICFFIGLFIEVLVSDYLSTKHRYFLNCLYFFLYI